MAPSYCSSCCFLIVGGSHFRKEATILRQRTTASNITAYIRSIQPSSQLVKAALEAFIASPRFLTVHLSVLFAGWKADAVRLTDCHTHAQHDAWAPLDVSSLW